MALEGVGKWTVFHYFCVSISGWLESLTTVQAGITIGKSLSKHKLNVRPTWNNARLFFCVSHWKHTNCHKGGIKKAAYTQWLFFLFFGVFLFRVSWFRVFMFRVSWFRVSWFRVFRFRVSWFLLWKGPKTLAVRRVLSTSKNKEDRPGQTPGPGRTRLEATIIKPLLPTPTVLIANQWLQSNWNPATCGTSSPDSSGGAAKHGPPFGGAESPWGALRPYRLTESSCNSREKAAANLVGQLKVINAYPPGNLLLNYQLIITW